MAKTIRFPKMHLAASVSNRILNVADGLPAVLSDPVESPVLPDVAAQGAVLDQQIATPPRNYPEALTALWLTLR